jgi:hypothetical protein
MLPGIKICNLEKFWRKKLKNLAISTFLFKFNFKNAQKFLANLNLPKKTLFTFKFYSPKAQTSIFATPYIIPKKDQPTGSTLKNTKQNRLHHLVPLQKKKYILKFDLSSISIHS